MPRTKSGQAASKKGLQKGHQKAAPAVKHFMQDTESFEHHEVSAAEHERIRRLHVEEYSAEHSHSVAGTSMFKSHAGTKNHQADLKKEVDRLHHAHGEYKPTISVSVNSVKKGDKNDKNKKAQAKQGQNQKSQKKSTSANASVNTHAVWQSQSAAEEQKTSHSSYNTQQTRTTAAAVAEEKKVSPRGRTGPTEVRPFALSSPRQKDISHPPVEHPHKPNLRVHVPANYPRT
jgi:hypothetical protein